MSLALVPAAGARRPLVVAAVAVLAWTTLAAWIGYQAIDPSWARSTLVTSGAGIPRAGFLTILGTNLGAALLLFSGAATGGFTTLLGATWTGGYVGATLAVAVENAGAGPLLGRVWPYMPLEFGAMLVAAVAGAFPLLAALLPSPEASGTTAVTRYLRASRTSLGLLALSTLGLVAAALVESVVAS